MTSSTTDIPGLDLAAFRRWYDGQRPGEIAGDLRGRVIAGGRSNLTYEVTDGTVVVGACAARRSATCRRPRTTWAASTRVMTALADDRRAGAARRTPTAPTRTSSARRST